MNCYDGNIKINICTSMKNQNSQKQRYTMTCDMKAVDNTETKSLCNIKSHETF